MAAFIDRAFVLICPIGRFIGVSTVLAPAWRQRLASRAGELEFIAIVAPLARGELPVKINTNSSQNISPSLLGVALLPQRGMGLHGRGVRDYAHLSAASDTAPLADETPHAE